MKDSSLHSQKQKGAFLVVLISDALLALVVLILNLLTLQFTGVSDSPYAHLGAGAIWSSILLMLGQGSIIAANFVKE